MDLKLIECEGVDWIEVSHDMAQYTVMNLWAP
jgi:hypothetical protein